MLCKIVLPSNEIFKLYPFPRSFQDLRDIVKSRLGGASLDNITLKYIDSDKELVVLNSEEDLQTAIITSQAEQVKTLKIYVQPHGDAHNMKIKNSRSENSATVTKRGYDLKSSSSGKKDELSVINSQLQAIDGFIGAKVKEVVSYNMKGLISGLAKKLKSQEELGYDVSRSAPISSKVEGNCIDCVCSECKDHINGVRYVCLECANYKSCEACEARGDHMHPLLKVRNVMNQSVGIEDNYRNKYSNLFLTPEKKGSSAQRYSFQRSATNSGEKKTTYSAKLALENSREQKIKTYPFQEEKVAVVIKNNGSEAWPRDVRLCCINGVYRNREESLLPLAPGEKQVITLYLRAPCKIDRYLSQWKLYYTEEAKAKSFGESLFIEFLVEEKRTANKQSMTPCKNLSTNLTRRAMAITEAFFARNENNVVTPRKDKKLHVAEWLNEVFPGELEEKLEFLNSCDFHGDLEDMSRVVELYLQSLSRRCEKKAKAQGGFTPRSHEICAALV